MNIERDNTISVKRKYTREEMIESFYNTKEALQNLEVQIQEQKNNLEIINANILQLEESKKNLVWFLQEAGAVLDKTKKK